MNTSNGFVDERKVYFASSFFLKYIVIVGFGISALMGWIIHEMSTTSQKIDGTFFIAVSFCLAPILLFGSVSIIALYRIFFPMPSVILDSAGVRIGRMIKMGAIIPWDQITEIKPDVINAGRAASVYVVRFKNSAGVTPDFVQVMSLPIGRDNFIAEAETFRRRFAKPEI